MGSNYHIWAMKIASILRSRRIYREIIEGDEPTKPLDSSTNVDEWKKYDEWQAKNDEAFGVIILSLITEQAAMFINETRAKRVWESLKNMYGGNNEEKIIDAMLELKDLRMARSENVNQYVTRIKGMVAKVIALGGKITDREAVYYLVRGLDSRLENIAVVLRTRKDQNIDEVHQILKEEETRLGKNTETGGWSKNREENAYRSRQKGSKQDRVKARECYVCGKIGHIARECWHKNKVRVNKEHEVREVKMKNEYAQIMNDETQRHNAFSCTQKHVEKKSMAHSKWNLDSGCSVHMTSERKYLKQIEPNESIINMAETGRNIKAVEKGGMNMKTMVDGKEVNLKMTNVLYVPKLRDNLLSVGELVRRGNRVEFDETGATIYGKAGRIIAKGKEENNMYVVEGWIVGQDVENNDKCTKETEQCALSRQDEKMIWHRRLGHLNGYYMDKMRTGNVVRGLTYSGGTDLKCESCILGKMTEMTYKRVDGPIANRPLDLLYMDLCGPMGKASLGGNRYIFVIVDAYTKRIFIELLTYKSETYDRFMKFKRRSENQMGTQINRIRTDNGTEFVNQQFKDMFKREGVKHERTVIYSPSSNGLAERTNRTLLGTVRTMLIDSKLPIHFWGEATITAAYLRNCGYRKGLDGITPMEKWSGRKPCVKHLKPFGCVAYGLVPKPLRNKLGPRGRKGIMVGYSRDRRAYRLYMLDQDRVEEFRSVTFIEDENGSKYMGSTGENTLEVEQIRYNLDGENERIQTETGRNRLERFVTHEVIKDRTEEPSETQQQMEDGEIQEERREIENEQMEDEDTGDTDTPEPDINLPELNQELQVELEDSGQAPRRGRPVGTKKGVVQTRERRKCEETELECQRKGVRRSTRIEEKKRSEEHVNQTEIGKAEKKISKNYKEAMESEERDKWKQAMEEELKSMKEHEVWTLVDRKPQKKVCICADYKVGLNQCNIDTYPLPIIDDMLAKLANGKIFSKLDLAQAYQQVKMDKDSAELLSINTHLGLFAVSRLPFGVSSAPAIFQSLMDNLLKSHKNVVCYLDDILIASPDISSHINDLKNIFKTLLENGIHLNLEKCEFLKDKVEYLGHVISDVGVKPNPAKLKALLTAPAPSNIDQLRSFLGLLGYYRKFVPDLASNIPHLNKLLSNKVTWEWNKLCQNEFEIIKKILTSEKVLTHYDPCKPLILAADASPYGIGAVLSHRFPDNSEKPIMFASRTLSITEKNYSQLDREALSIIFAVKKFHKYILGRKFTLYTDHKPLTRIFSPGKEIPTLAVSRLQRWALILATYSFDIKYKPSKDQSNADALSRLPIKGEASAEENFENIFSIQENDYFPWSKSDIAQLTKTDLELNKIYNFLKNGWPKFDKKDNSLAEWTKRKDQLSLQEGCILWGLRVIIPKTLRSAVLKELHQCHIGITKMKLLARSICWWPNLDRDIENESKSCRSCQLQQKDPPKVTLHPWIRPTGPWTRLHTDLLGPYKNHMFLVTVDAYSKWPEIQALPKADSLTIMHVLEQYFVRFGYPEHLVSDNGTPFTSKEFESFCHNRGIHHSKSPPFHPASNGQAERFVDIAKCILNKMDLIKESDWQIKINEALFKYRSTPHATLKISPAELLLGRPLRGRLQKVNPLPSIPPLSFKNKFYAGQNILARAYGKYDRTKWIEGRIKAVLSPVTFQVIFKDGREGKRHFNQLRPSFLATTPTVTPESDLIALPSNLSTAQSRANPPTTQPSVTISQPSTPTTQASLPTLNVPDRLGTPSRTLPETSTRRSNRPRRPPERLTYKH